MESPQRKSSIPLPKSKTGSNMRRQNSMFALNIDLQKPSSPMIHSQIVTPTTAIPPTDDLDSFVLLEENILLKESKEQLIKKNMESMQINLALEHENKKLTDELNMLRTNFKSVKDELQRVTSSFQDEMVALKKQSTMFNEQKTVINNLMTTVKEQQASYLKVIEASQVIKQKLGEFIPEDPKKVSDTDVFSIENLENIISEISKLKMNQNNIELQLYEANEKIADLLEHQQHLEEENECLKLENSKLTDVAKLLTTSMKESTDTTMQMEKALIMMKQRNDRLSRNGTDTSDSPVVRPDGSHQKQSNSDQTESSRQNVQDDPQSERIVEMTDNDTSTDTKSGADVDILQMKIRFLEDELKLALEKLEKAELELKMYRNQNPEQSVANKTLSTLEPTTSPPPPPPPPPPPIPLMGINFNSTKPTNNTSTNESDFESNLSQSLSNIKLKKCNTTDQRPVKATGMDALINELRGSGVTLRRNRTARKEKVNTALQEMFNCLETSRAQNRSSRLFIKTIDNTEINES